MAKGTGKSTTGGGKNRQGSSSTKGNSGQTRRRRKMATGDSTYENENNSVRTKGSGRYLDDNQGTGSSTKGNPTYDDRYENDTTYNSSGSKDNSYDGYTEDNNNGSSSKRGYSENYNDAYSSKDSSPYDDANDYEESAHSKEVGTHHDDYGSGTSTKRDSSYNESYDGNTNYDTGNSKGGGSHSEDEPINDPPYDDYNEEVVAKRPNTDRLRDPYKGGGDEGEADMTFTEEEVYGEERSDTPISPQDSHGSTIRRVWVWAGGAVPRHAIGNPQATWWRTRFGLGMTDYVIALNDHDFNNGLGIKSNYIDPNNSGNRWAPICDIMRIVNDAGVAPHLMIFFPPNPGIIREAADVLSQIIENSPVMPRSIQLDLEGWWTRRGPRERSAGERAIQEYFVDRWSTRRPELGLGITCIGSVPQPIYGAMSKVDFAIPQMYASERNYGRPISENSVRRHYSRAAEALGPQSKIIVGQTAYSRYVNPQVMKEMLEVVLRQRHANSGGVNEIAYWSDVHLMNSSRNRQFFQSLTNLVRNEGLTLGNINRL